MRRRIVITLIAVVAIGVGAYVLSRPRRGSLEWHKREYLKALDQVLRSSLWERLTGTVESSTGLPVAQALAADDRNYRTLNTHMKFLIENGFLMSANHRIRSEDMWPVVQRAFNEARKRIPEPRGQFTYVQRNKFLGTNGEVVSGVFVISRPKDAALWGELIRKADAAAMGY